MIQYYYLYKNIPRLDLHGKTSFEMIVLVDGFIKENKAMKNYLIGIIHGKGSGILKRELHKYCWDKVEKGIFYGRIMGCIW